MSDPLRPRPPGRRLAPLTPRTLKHWSPILPSERDRVERMLSRLRTHGVKDVDDRQRIADALRPPLARVDRVATAGYVEIGRWLSDIKSLLPHGTFLSLFQGHGRGAIETPLPLSVGKAQALMRVATHPVLSDPKQYDHLPIESWRTLDELTRLPPDVLQMHLASGRISRETTRREVLALGRRPEGWSLDGPPFRPHPAGLPGTFAVALARAIDLGRREGRSGADIAARLRSAADEVEQDEQDDRGEAEEEER